jgi:hypothetical protein
MKKPKDFLIRRWLNKRGHHSTGLVYASITCDDNYGLDNAEFTVGDCSRSVTLDFMSPSWSRDDREKRYANELHKINTLIEAAIQFRDALEIAYEWDRAHKEERDS